jgi:NADPH:quinone reductase-like Zn-dependent oxidoreductase
MRAIQFTEFGGPEVLKVVDLPEPHPANGQIRVRVHAVGINPIDWKVRRGMMGGDLPKVTGQEVSGVVDEIGEGVTGVAEGDEVFGPAAGGGGAAEYALLANWASIPSSLDFAGAAALPVAVETAARTLDLLDVGDGQTVLVNGAAGAVGIAIVQLAQERGARVIGTASAGNHEYLRAYGAEATTYGDGLVERVREIAGRAGPVIDRAIDAAGGGALPALVELAGGPEHVVTIADYEGAQQTGVTMTGGPDSVRAWYALGQAAELIEAGRFSLPVAQTFPLEQIAEAHALSETGHVRGKLVLLID